MESVSWSLLSVLLMTEHNIPVYFKSTMLFCPYENLHQVRKRTYVSCPNCIAETLHLRWDDHDGIVTHGRSREIRMHMKNPAQTGSGCIRFSDWKIENATFAEYVCPIRLRGARYLYLNVAVEKRNISGVYRYNWVSERITTKYWHLIFKTPFFSF
jgi:hypothetical protein